MGIYNGETTISSISGVGNWTATWKRVKLDKGGSDWLFANMSELDIEFLNVVLVYHRNKWLKRIIGREVFFYKGMQAWDQMTHWEKGGFGTAEDYSGKRIDIVRNEARG